jgi:hypothetical protein
VEAASSVVRLARSSAEPEQRRQQAEAISTGKTNDDKKNAPLVKEQRPRQSVKINKCRAWMVTPF